MKNESPQWSEVQAVLSRGDSNLAAALAAIEKESLSAWNQAIEQHRIDADFFAHRKWEANMRLPWAIIKSE